MRKTGIRYFLRVGIGVLFFVSFAAAQNEEQWLQYHCSRDAREIMVEVGGRGLKVSDKKPKGIELPKFECDTPLFANWTSPMVKGKELWIALDRTTKHGQYDILYMDVNGNGKIEESESIKAYRVESYRSNFGPVKIVFDSADGPITYHLNFYSYNYNERSRSLMVSSAGWYEGDIIVGTQKKHCVLIDYDADGTFNNKSINFSKCDRILIGKKERPEINYVGNYIEIDGKLYQPEVARDGAYIKISPAQNVVFGNVKVQETIKELKAGGENGLFTVHLEKGIGKLPVGKYRIYRWIVEKKDKGSLWKLEGEWFGDKGIFDVKKGEEIALAVGEPVISNLRVRKRNKEYSINQELKGRLGERIEITKNGRRGEPPKLNIESMDRKYDRNFNLEYG